MKKFRIALGCAVIGVLVGMHHAMADTLSWAAPTTYADAASTPLPAGSTLTYNVYQDGKALTTTPISALTYTIASTCAAHTYQVTAILGSESALSAPPTVGLIAATCAPKPPTAVKITAG